MPLSIPFFFRLRRKTQLHNNCKRNEIGLMWINVIYHHHHHRHLHRQFKLFLAQSVTAPIWLLIQADIVRRFSHERSHNDNQIEYKLVHSNDCECVRACCCFAFKISEHANVNVSHIGATHEQTNNQMTAVYLYLSLKNNDNNKMRFDLITH